MVAQAGSALLVDTVHKSAGHRSIGGTYAVIQAVGRAGSGQDFAVALDGGRLADVGMLRAEAGVFGPVASDPTGPRLVAALAASGLKALAAIRATCPEYERGSGSWPGPTLRPRTGR